MALRTVAGFGIGGTQTTLNRSGVDRASSSNRVSGDRNVACWELGVGGETTALSRLAVRSGLQATSLAVATLPLLDLAGRR